MPFGLTNAPATFQALMNKIFAPYLRKFVLVFFDDILIFSKTVEEHKEHLAIVMELLKKHNLLLNQSKCTFGTPTVEYLGHILSAQGVATDPEKITAVKNWPIPSNTTELRSFLGLAGYYRRFIRDYGLICRPLHDLLKKDSFLWTPTQTAAFEQLKYSLTNAPFLALPDFSLPFELECDASGAGVGAVLMQQHKPIAYYSKSLGPKAAALSTYEKEAIAILESLRKWRHYRTLNFPVYLVQIDRKHPPLEIFPIIELKQWKPKIKNPLPPPFLFYDRRPGLVELIGQHDTWFDRMSF